MTTHTDRGSANIYAFPARGRYALSGGRDEATVSPTVMTHAVAAAVGSGWYHDVAIQDSERARKI